MGISSTFPTENEAEYAEATEDEKCNDCDRGDQNEYPVERHIAFCNRKQASDAHGSDSQRRRSRTHGNGHRFAAIVLVLFKTERDVENIAQIRTFEFEASARCENGLADIRSIVPFETKAEGNGQRGKT
jgi:hypothetical protein